MELIFGGLLAWFGGGMLGGVLGGASQLAQSLAAAHAMRKAEEIRARQKAVMPETPPQA